MGILRFVLVPEPFHRSVKCLLQTIGLVNFCETPGPSNPSQPISPAYTITFASLRLFVILKVEPLRNLPMF